MEQNNGLPRGLVDDAAIQARVFHLNMDQVDMQHGFMGDIFQFAPPHLNFPGLPHRHLCDQQGQGLLTSLQLLPSLPAVSILLDVEGTAHREVLPYFQVIHFLVVLCYSLQPCEEKRGLNSVIKTSSLGEKKRLGEPLVLINAFSR